MADLTCSIDGCEKPEFSRTWCNGHYRRWQKRGTVDEHIPLRVWGRRRSCAEPGCENAYSASGRCVDHQIGYWHRKHAQVADAGTWRTPGRERCNVTLTPATERSPAGRQRTKRRIGDRLLDAEGYVRIKVGTTYPGHAQGWVAEHRFVMERTLGRQLTDGENVHHRNGVRHDNRSANLELWVSAQPAGQRPADLVEWAHKILDRYEADVQRNQLKSQDTWTKAGAVALGTSRRRKALRASAEQGDDVLQLHLDVSA